MRVTTETIGFSAMIICSFLMTTDAFLPNSMHHHHTSGLTVVTPSRTSSSSAPTNNVVDHIMLRMAGFGGGGGGGATSKKKGGGKNRPKKNKTPPVTAGYKPKQQWDRYSDLKRETKIRVAVRILDDDGDEENNDWLEVGRIKSKENSYTAIAVALQRALIAEVSLLETPRQATCCIHGVCLCNFNLFFCR